MSTLVAPFRLVGLGLLVGAVLHVAAARAGAQVRDTLRRPPDTVRVPVALPPEDSAALAVADTAERLRRLADTIKAPLPRAPLPAPLGIAPRYYWDRDALFATGALTLLELIDDIPGVTDFRTGWIATPQLATYLGRITAVRLFLDNIELAPLSPRAGEAIDLAEIPLWPLEEVVVERGAGELRVYMRSWTVRRTTPFTRTDVYTGDEETNIYRGFFGKRFANGAALQLAGEQYGTSGQRFGDGDQLALLGRVGIGRARWAADAFVLRSNRVRQPQIPRLGGDPLPGLDARTTTAYLRGSIGDLDAGPWFQLVAASQAYRLNSPETTTPDEDAETDTTRSVADYIASGGMTWGETRVIGEARARVGGGETQVSQRARITTLLGPVAARLFAEHGAVESVTRVDATIEAPLFGPFFALASAGWVDDGREDAARERSVFGRAEIGLLTPRLWLTGGLVYRDSAVISPAEIFARDLVPVAEGPAIGATASLRGKVWRDVGVDVSFIGWESGGPYRPQYHANGRIFLQSNWLSRFPSGNFGILASGGMEFRSEVAFPTADGLVYTEPAVVFNTLLEIRIVDAILTWQIRNVRPAIDYTQVPGFLMPGPVNLYGVRWYFWN